MHVVNNLFENSSDNGHALDASGSNLRLLAEDNYFSSVAIPVAASVSDRGQICGIYRQTTASQNAGKQAFGRICTSNGANPMPSNDNLRQDSAVLRALSAVKGSVLKPYSASNMPDTMRAKAGAGKL